MVLQDNRDKVVKQVNKVKQGLQDHLVKMVLLDKKDLLVHQELLDDVDKRVNLVEVVTLVLLEDRDHKVQLDLL